MAEQLIEKYAGLALQGIMANPVYFNYTPERIADDAYRAAAELVLKLKHEKDRYLRDVSKEIAQLKTDLDGIPIFERCQSFLNGVNLFEDKVICLKVTIQQILSKEASVVFDDSEDKVALQIGYVSRKTVLDNLNKTAYVYVLVENGDWSISRIREIPIEPSSSDEEIITIRDGTNFVAEKFHGKKVRFVGRVVITNKNNITVELEDSGGSMFDIRLGDTPAPTFVNSHDLYYVYATVNTKENGWKYLYSSIDRYIKIRDGQITVETAIELIEQGKCAEVITLEAENVFYQNRDSAGDRRAAWKALEYSLLDHGIQKHELEDRTSSNQVESISQLIVDYIFAKYS
jgi:hypothetical protein